jgi:hypothetical protein
LKNKYFSIPPLTAKTSEQLSPLLVLVSFFVFVSVQEIQSEAGLDAR